MRCDLNCDMGEGFGNDAEIIPFVSSVNISCGYHAGNEQAIKETIQHARQHRVAIGAHPSFPDRENFGRTEITGVSPSDVYNWTVKQVHYMQRLTYEAGVVLHHVKPHGAMYNMAARDKNIAKAIIEAIAFVDKSLWLYGLSGSCLITEATSAGVKAVNEVFADRTYQDDGTLTHRNQPSAVIETLEECVQQAVNMITQGHVVTLSGHKHTIIAETICLHGDGANALQFAKHLHEELSIRGIVIKAP